MQIKNIVLYGRGARRRIVNFEPGKVNIITGDSKTGKSVLIEIVDYCIGSDYAVSSGVVNNFVTWFGIRLQLDAGQIFIARPNPTKKSLAGGQPSVFLLQGDEIDVPDVSALVPNATQDAFKALMGNLVGIDEYFHRVDGFTRQDLAVTFKHSRIYCFQPQTDIDQKDFLFFHQKKDFGVEQAIKDTLPYFLGAVPRDFVQIERELSEKKRRFNRLQRELKEAEAITAKSSSRASTLITEAKQVALLRNDVFPETDDEAIRILKDVGQAQLEEIQPIGENENLLDFQARREVLQSEMNELVEAWKAAEQFERETFSYAAESMEQLARLESVNLFGVNSGKEDSHCPLCTQTLSTPIPTAEKISDSLRSLTSNLAITRKEQPRLKEFIEDKKTRIDALRVEISSVDRSIAAIYRQRRDLEQTKNLNIEKGKILGRISLYLESEALTEDFSDLRRRIEILKSEITGLEKQIGSDEIQERLNSILGELSVYMSEWAKTLQLEFKDAIIQFSVKQLTLFIVTEQERMRLERIGSGENWVAYHLLIHFALHRHFVIHNRPVPRFLMIDQFSQAYLPPEGVKDSADNQAIRRICDYIFDRTDELNGKFQVILTEHAEPKYSRFTKAIVERWRDGNKLVPVDWVENESEQLRD